MFKITHKQIVAQTAVHIPSFTPYMLRHLRQHFPSRTRLLSEKELTAFIHEGIHKARSYYFTARYEACLFIDIMAMLGGQFDKDPLLAWFLPVLLEAPNGNQRKRIERLYQVALSQLKRTQVAQDIYPIKPLKALLDIPLARPHTAPVHPDPQDLQETLRRIWPEKYVLALEHRSLEGFMKHAAAKAARHGFDQAYMSGYFSAMLFVFGSGADEDGFYAWISKTLGDHYSDAHQRYVALYNCLSVAAEELEPVKIKFKNAT